MRDAFGRDDLVHYEDRYFWTCDYEIIAFDLERMFFSSLMKRQTSFFHTVSAPGSLMRLKNSSHWYAYCTVYYVACYLKMPDL